MRTLQISLSQEMYLELLHAASQSTCEGIDDLCTAEDFAKECIESVLAERRLDKRLKRLEFAVA